MTGRLPLREVTLLSQRSLWIDHLSESASDFLPSGQEIAVVNQFRRWGEFDRDRKEWGCPNPECRCRLYDRLTLWFLDGLLIEHHLNSSSVLARLRKLKTQADTVLPG